MALVLKGSVDVPGFFKSSTKPTSPQEGDLWLRTTTNKLYMYIDSAWVQQSPAGGVGIYNSSGTKVN